MNAKESTGEIMLEKTQELLKKFEQDHEIYVGATDALTYWIVDARTPTGKEGFHNLHTGKRYVSGPNEGGNVLILRIQAIPMPTSQNPGGRWERSTIL